MNILYRTVFVVNVALTPPSFYRDQCLRMMLCFPSKLSPVPTMCKFINSPNCVVFLSNAFQHSSTEVSISIPFHHFSGDVLCKKEKKR